MKKNRPKRKLGPPRQRRTKLKRLRHRLEGYLPSLRYVWAFIAGLSALLTIVGTTYNFSPNVSVVPDSVSEGPAFILFVLTNESYLPLHEVGVSCKTRDIEPSQFADEIQQKEIEAGRDPNEMSGLGSLSLEPGPAYKAQTLSPNERKSITCPLPTYMLKYPITRAIIDIDVKYRPDWIPWQQQRKFRFKGHVNKDGRLVWNPPRIL